MRGQTLHQIVGLVSNLLKCPLEPVESDIIRAGFDLERLTENRDRTGEWLGDLDPVPAAQPPATFERDREGQDGSARPGGEQQRTGLGHIERTARSIHRKAGAASGTNRPDHLDQRGSASTGRAATRGAVSKTLDETRDVLRIEAARGHDNDAPASEKIGADRNAVVPEADHLWSPGPIVLSANDGETDRSPDQQDQPVEQPADEADDQALLERVLVERGKSVEGGQGIDSCPNLAGLFGGHLLFLSSISPRELSCPFPFAPCGAGTSMVQAYLLVDLDRILVQRGGSPRVSESQVHGHGQKRPIAGVIQW